MLEIENIIIEYSRLILKVPYVRFIRGLNVIQGESGCGKSSLLRCISLNEDICESYIYCDKSIDDKANFKKFYISYLEQSPIFIDHLLIKDHIAFLEKAYSFHEIHNYIEKLQINELLDKYPNQLSGGEKTRIGLLLRLMKQSDILILDEPTSSLDLEYTHIVMDILKDYAKDHIVIIASHDEEVMQCADFLYKIEDKTLKEIISKERKQISSHKKEVKSLPTFILNMKLKKREKLFQKIMNIILVITLFLLSSTISVVWVNQSSESDDLSDVYQNELLVYKSPVPESDYYVYEGNGQEYPISDEELKSISNIQDIVSIEETYLINSWSNLLEMQDVLNYEEDDLFIVTLLDENKNEIKSVDAQNPSVFTTNDLLRCTYNEKEDYSQDIEIQLNNKDDGIYISKLMAEFIGIDQITRESYLEFVLLIPTHVGYGDATISLTQGGLEYPVCSLLGKRIKVCLPINGILESSDMGLGIHK